VLPSALRRFPERQFQGVGIHEVEQIGSGLPVFNNVPYQPKDLFGVLALAASAAPATASLRAYAKVSGGDISSIRIRDAAAREMVVTVRKHPHTFLDLEKVRNYKQVYPANSRLRALIDDTVGAGMWKLLWIPRPCPITSLPAPSRNRS